MTKTFHKGRIPLTIYPPNSNLWQVMLLSKQGKDYKAIAGRLGMSLNESYKAVEELKRQGEI